ncbi:zinc finger protein 488 [Molossus molossus]|uniref:zinc finger protein 488 n=1 Tax=Molossus molossus TaxID=27622 RepID=UPI001745F87B|nr:zinc finger protein 488 [Molossus molossus]
MAAGKGVLWSPPVETRGWLSEPQPVLLEKRNHPSSEAAVGGAGQGEAPSTPPGTLSLGTPPARWGQGRSAFAEVPRFKKRLRGRRAKDGERADLTGQPGPRQLARDTPRAPGGRTALSGWPRGAGREQRGAFSQPAGCPSGRPGSASLLQAGGPADAPGELWGLVKMVDMPCRGHLSSSKLLAGGFWSLSVPPQYAPLRGGLLGAPTLWLQQAVTQTPTPASPSPASWALLPPTCSSPGATPQNWCAKCSASFRLTSDLVLHMRSRHKKEPVRPDPRSRQLRREALTCPVCREDFRERHHLSRHLTAHR